MILSHSERHFLSLIIGGGSISVGSSIGASLHQRGMVTIVRNGQRYGITQAGIAALLDAVWAPWPPNERDGKSRANFIASCERNKRPRSA
jgi:hypothetical protein